jgi:hypothetical protein
MKAKSRLNQLQVRPPARATTSQTIIDKAIVPAPAPSARTENRIQELEAKLAVALQRIDELEMHTSLKRKHFDVSDYEIGILNYLRLCEISPFQRRFICSQSSAELYGILNPNCQNYYGSPDKGDAWIQFEFKRELTVFGFLIQSYLSCFIKSYRIVSINSDLAETVLFATDSEVGLQGELKEVAHKFERPVKTKIIRFEQTGKSWTDKNFIGLKRFDFLTDQCQGHYFEHLLQFAGGDPHKLPVNLTARYFDVYSFLSMNPSSYICTFDAPTPSWFQIEFLLGCVCISGYRLKRHEVLKMKKWSLRGSNDATLELDKWIMIHETEEPKDGPVCKVYTCPQSQPYKYLRIVMDSPGWNDRSYLAFWHFELFGDYILN